MASPLNDPKLEALLNRLHAQSDIQVDETNAYFTRREQETAIDQEDFYDDDTHHFLSDKMVALDRDKAEYYDYFEFVNDPRNRFRTMTVPFAGGFELTVRV